MQSDGLIERLFVEPLAEGEDPRRVLDALAQSMRGQAETFDPAVSHYQAGGLYGRRVYVPAGVCVSTRVHKQDHITVALAGECWVVDEQGQRSKIVAPAVFMTPAGTGRAVYAVTDTQWLTVHAADAVADVSQQLQRLTAGSFAEYENDVLVNALMALDTDADDLDGPDGEAWS